MCISEGSLPQMKAKLQAIFKGQNITEQYHST